MHWYQFKLAGYLLCRTIRTVRNNDCLYAAYVYYIHMPLSEAHMHTISCHVYVSVLTCIRFDRPNS